MPSGMLFTIVLTGNKADWHSNWDEDKVIDWLKRINCAQYIELFRRTSYTLAAA